MPLPLLDQWDVTIHSLHRAGQILGALRLALLPAVPNYLELSTRITPQGLSTDGLPGGAEVRLDFTSAAMIVRHPDGTTATLALRGHSQRSLCEAVLAELQKTELSDGLAGAGEGARVEKLRDLMAATEHPLLEEHDSVTDEQPLEVDAALSADYATTLNAVFTAAARFRARLSGFMTPVVVWPEHFDLSFLWFAGEPSGEEAPLMNFGFAPFGGGIKHPYLYAYAYPMPDNAIETMLPAPAYWHTEGWRGAVVPYAQIAHADDPVAFVEGLYEGIYKALLPMVR